MLVYPGGHQEKLACFERDNIEAFGACSISWRNQLYIFGGAGEQVSKLIGYKLKRIGYLWFKYQYGTCSVMNNQYVYLCFSRYLTSDLTYKGCRRSTGPLETYSAVTLSKYDHREAQISCSDSRFCCLFSSSFVLFSATLVAVGSAADPLHASPHTKKSEKLEDGSWTDIEEPPVSNSFSQYAVIFHAGNFYYFGGYDDGHGSVNSVLRLNAVVWTWSNFAHLNSARQNHGVILVQNTFMVIGGLESKPNEACFLEDRKLSCTKLHFSLSRNYNNPLLFLVNYSYGNC